MSEVSLTPRQLQFLTLVSEGKSYAMIAEECNVSITTVQNTLDEAKHRLGAVNMPHAVRRSMSLNILSVAA